MERRWYKVWPVWVPKDFWCGKAYLRVRIGLMDEDGYLKILGRTRELSLLVS